MLSILVVFRVVVNCLLLVRVGMLLFVVVGVVIVMVTSVSDLVFIMVINVLLPDLVMIIYSVFNVLIGKSREVSLENIGLTLFNGLNW